MASQNFPQPNALRPAYWDQRFQMGNVGVPGYFTEPAVGGFPWYMPTGETAFPGPGPGPVVTPTLTPDPLNPALRPIYWSNRFQSNDMVVPGWLTQPGAQGVPDYAATNYYVNRTYPGYHTKNLDYRNRYTTRREYIPLWQNQQRCWAMQKFNNGFEIVTRPVRMPCVSASFSLSLSFDFSFASVEARILIVKLRARIHLSRTHQPWEVGIGLP